MKGATFAHLAAWCLAFVWLAGCAQPSNPSPSAPSGGSLPPASSSGGPTTTSESALPAPGFGLALSECELLRHQLDYEPANTFKPEYPPGAEPQPIVGGLHVAFMEFFTCRQADDGAAIQEGFEVFAFAGVIKAPEGAPDDLTTAALLFQVYSNSRAFIDHANATYGLRVDYLDHISIDKMPVPQSPFPGSTYSMRVSHEGQTPYSFDGHLSEGGGERRQDREAFFFLGKSGKLDYFLVEYDGGIRGSSGGAVSFGPSSYWAQHSDVDSWEFTNTLFLDTTAELRFYTGI